VDVFPQSGRWHQIRRHLNHAAHPVVGDVEHGDNSRNHFFREQFQSRRLMLAATGLHFRHPRDGRALSWECAPATDFQSLVEDLQPYAVSATEVSVSG
jgi:tRNA pseudouridine65 synthase